MDTKDKNNYILSGKILQDLLKQNENDFSKIWNKIIGTFE